MGVGDREGAGLPSGGMGHSDSVHDSRNRGGAGMGVMLVWFLPALFILYSLWEIIDALFRIRSEETGLLRWGKVMYNIVLIWVYSQVGLFMQSGL